MDGKGLNSPIVLATAKAYAKHLNLDMSKLKLNNNVAKAPGSVTATETKSTLGLISIPLQQTDSVAKEKIFSILNKEAGKQNLVSLNAMRITSRTEGSTLRL